MGMVKEKTAKEKKREKERERRALSRKLAREKAEAVAVMIKKYHMKEGEVLKIWDEFHEQNPDGEMSREDFLLTKEVNIEPLYSDQQSLVCVYLDDKFYR